MSTSTDTPVVDLDKVDDGSSFAPGFDTGAFVQDAAGVARSFVKTLASTTAITQAWALIVGIICINTRDADDFPAWNVGQWPQAAKMLLAEVTQAAGLADGESQAIAAAVRTYFARTARPMFVASYVLSSYEGAAYKSMTEQQPQAINNYARALKLLPEGIRAMLPEDLREEIFAPAGVNAAFKKGMREQYSHASILASLPVIYGGEVKDGNAKVTKDKNPASAQTELESVAVSIAHSGEEGGPSFASVASGIHATASAFLVALFAASEVQDRENVREIVEHISTVTALTLKTLDGKTSPEEMESAPLYVPAGK